MTVGAPAGVDVAAAKNPTVETTSPKSDLPEVEESKYHGRDRQGDGEIATKDNVFEPRYVKVSKGPKITCYNVGAVPHNVLPADQGPVREIPAEDLTPGCRRR